MKIRPGIELANLSDVGLERTSNEDYYAYWESDNDDEFRRKGRLAVIADGMGGYSGGEEASRLAVQAVCETYKESDGAPQDALLSGFRSAHDRIRRRAMENAELASMGTTCTAVSLMGSDLYYAHVGDSRLYLLRDGVLSCITNDHSRVMEMVRAGILRPEDAATHPDRNILTRAIGVNDDLQADIPLQLISLQKGDILLLCTDGLWGTVNNEQLRSVLNELPPKKACKELVQLGIDNGAPDNITLQILKINGDGRESGTGLR